MIGVLTFVWGAVAYLMRHRQTFLTVVIGSALTDAFNLYLGESVFSVAGGLGAVVLLHRRGIDATFARRAGPLFIVLALPVVVGFYFVAVEPFDDPYAAYRATTQQLGFKYVVQVLRIPEIALAAYAAYVGVSAHANPRGALLRSFSQLVTLVAVATAIDFLSGDALKALLFERTTDDRVTGLSVEPRQLAREMGLLLLTLLTVMSHRLRETRTRWLAFAAILLLLGTYSVSGLATTALVTFGYLVYRYPRDYRTYLAPVAFVGVAAIAISTNGAIRWHVEQRTVKKLQTALLNYVPNAPIWVSGLEVFDGAAVAFFYNNPTYLALGTGPNLINIPSSAYVSRYQRIIFPYGLVATPHMGLISMISNGGIAFVLLQLLVWARFVRRLSPKPELATFVCLVFVFNLIVTVSYLYFAAALALGIQVAEARAQQMHPEWQLTGGTQL